MQSINYYIQCPDAISTAIDAMNAQKKENLAKSMMEFLVYGCVVQTKLPATIKLVQRINDETTINDKGYLRIISALISLSQSAPTID